MSAQLIIDTASPTVFVGIMRAGSWLHLEKIHAHALDALFDGVSNCLQATGLKLKDIDDIFYCCGPGSTLGLRVAAMAIRTWSLLFPKMEIRSYTSLEVAVRGLSQPGIVVARCGQTGWYACKKLTEAQYSLTELHPSLENLQASGLPLWEFPSSKPSLIQKAQFPCIQYDLTPLPGLLTQEPSLARSSAQATPLSLSEPHYVHWNAQRHR